jgi:hypothetical protein
MNLFKKALVASAIVTACGSVNAADLTTPSTVFSKEGLAAETGSVTSGTALSTRVIVREQLEAGDKMFLTFSKGVDVDSAPAKGKAPAVGQIGYDYGSGDFTFTATAGTTNPTTGVTVITLEVDTGETIDANASFEIFVDSGSIAVANVDTASVTYTAQSGLGDNPAKDTTGNNGTTLVQSKSQYSATITAAKKLDGLIEREAMTTFTENGVTDETDTFEIKITDDVSLPLALKTTDQSSIIKLIGNLEDNATVPGQYTVTAAATTGTAVIAPATGVAQGTFALITTPGNTTTGLANTFTVEIDTNGLVIKASEYTVDVSADTDNGITTDSPVALIAGGSVGEFEVDATIVNLPYVPVNFDGLNSIVHMTNKTGTAVDVMVSAYSLEADGSSETYAQTSLVTIPAYSMKKVDGKTDIAAAFSITEPTKLNVTFNLDATKDAVDIYAFSNTSNGRTEISNSTQKGIK